MVLGEVAVDELFGEGDTLVGQRLQHEVMDRPKRILGERRRAKTILVGDHDQLEVRLLADEREVAKDARLEAQFPERIDLLVGRLLDERAIAVDEQNPFLCQSFYHIFLQFSRF